VIHLELNWELLGFVPKGADSVNLTLEIVQSLEDKGYIPGPLECIPFYDPGVKDTCWSATRTVTGVDGLQRTAKPLFTGSNPVVASNFLWLNKH